MNFFLNNWPNSISVDDRTAAQGWISVIREDGQVGEIICPADLAPLDFYLR